MTAVGHECPFRRQHGHVGAGPIAGVKEESGLLDFGKWEEVMPAVRHGNSAGLSSPIPLVRESTEHLCTSHSQLAQNLGDQGPSTAQVYCPSVCPASSS